MRKQLQSLCLGGCLFAGQLFFCASIQAASFQNAKLTAFDAAALDQFGAAVAIDGDTAIVGSLFDDDLGNASGSAYVYHRTGSLWSLQAKLTAGDGNAGERFGSSVSIAGNTIVVGSPFASHPTHPGTFAGAAYVYERTGSTWTQAAKLNASDPPQPNESAETFGFSVGISGNRIVVGNPINTGDSGQLGAAYVFEKSGVTWSEQIKLEPSDGAQGDQFGSAVAISGQSLVVGTDPFGGGNGAAYVFQGIGASWTEQAKLTPGDGGGGAFATSVDIDGTRAIVGDATGSAYVYQRNPTWSQEAKLTAFDAQPVDLFGASVSISGTKAVVGASHDDHPGGRTNAGSAYLFEHTDLGWAGLIPKFTALDRNAEDQLGTGVAISGDVFIAGTPFSNGSGLDSGSAYIFTHSATLPLNSLVGLKPSSANTTILSIQTSSFSTTPMVEGTGVGRLSGLDVQPGTGTFFASSGFGDGGRLFTIDAETGAATLVGATGFAAVPGLAFDLNGVLYASAATTNNGDTLITINPTTGVGTAIGALGDKAIESLAFDPTTGILYGGGGTGGNKLFSIDKTTGVATLLGVIIETATGNALPNFLAGLTFDNNGNLFGSLGGGDGRIIAIDLNQLTFANLGDAASGSVSDIAFVPEPNTVCLLTLGMLALLRRWDERR